MSEIDQLKKEIELLKQLVDTQKLLITQLQFQQPTYVPQYIPIWQVNPWQQYYPYQPITYCGTASGTSGTFTITSGSNVLTMGSK